MKSRTVSKEMPQLIGASLLIFACSNTTDEGAIRPTPAATVTDVQAGSQSTPVISATIREEILKLGDSVRGVQVRSQAGRISHIVGAGLAHGQTPQAAAASFVNERAKLLDISPTDLAAGRSYEDKSTEIPVMYDKETDEYKFTLVRQHQVSEGIPVFGSHLDTLHRNQSGHPIVLVKAATRNLKNFSPQFQGKRISRADASSVMEIARSTPDLEDKARQFTTPSLRNFADQQVVIWAGVENELATPRLAIRSVVDNNGSGEKPEKYLFVQDAETGEVLYKESMIIFEDVVGNVSGYVTDSFSSPDCDPVAVAPFPYAETSIESGASTFADVDGNYTITNSGTAGVNVVSAVKGEYFYVADYMSSRDEILSQSVTPPGPANFVHNPTNANEYVLAQSNGYVHANQVRDFVLTYHPSYPTIATQVNWPVNVNRTDGYCPGNAWYDYSSINFCASGSSSPNTSFASVNYHEYGHHTVSTGGSGQGEYGEGMSDSIAMLIADDPGIAYGFSGSDQCDSPLRNADNDCQYLASSCSTCGSTSHNCGKLLSGIIWDIRNELAATNPSNYLDIISNLTINSILLHTGTAIDATIAEDILTLDDDDGNIGNGTPHRAEICTGFEAHGLDCPELEEGMIVKPNTASSFIGPSGGPFIPKSAVYTLTNANPDVIDFEVLVDATWMIVSPTAGSIPAGNSVEISVLLTSEPDTMADGVYTGQVSFVNLTDHVGDGSQNITLTIGGPQPQITWDFNTDPGWTMDSGWEFGVPQGKSSDPTSGATGDNVIGYNLAGAYENHMDEFHLTTTAINCSNLSSVSLRYQRWLNVESSNYDHAYVGVSTDGVNFETVWKNAAETMQEAAWHLHEIDLSSIVDEQSTVYLRWTMGTTDGSVTYGGWNIDDVEIWGVDESPTDCTINDDCDDGLYCNGVETCVDNLCADGTPVVCDDGVACTVDTCDEATTSCRNVIDDTRCDDGLYCNGIETCTVTGCEAGTPIDCGDSIDCTNDSCDETNDSCANEADDTLCDDGIFCNGSEICGSAGCEFGTAPVCDDGVACTVDSCDTGLDACVNSADDDYCDNGLFCDGEETCDASAGCIDNANPCPIGCDEATQQCIDCEETTYEAENMNHSTGSAATDGWNIWSNGTASTTHDFIGGSTDMTVIARGDYAAGWPHMIVAVSGVEVYETYVETDVYTEYVFTFDAAPGTQEISIEFDNDYYDPPEDRNLIVDKVIVHCPGTVPTCDDRIQNGNETDVDCGGPDCDACQNGDQCRVDTDCVTKYCNDGICEEEPSGEVTAALVVKNEWPTGYCADIAVTNHAAASTTSWQVDLDTNGATIYTSWNGNLNGNSGAVSVTPVDWNSSIGSGGSNSSIGFCVNRSSADVWVTVTGASGTY